MQFPTKVEFHPYGMQKNQAQPSNANGTNNRCDLSANENLRQTMFSSAIHAGAFASPSYYGSLALMQGYYPQEVSRSHYSLPQQLSMSEGWAVGRRNFSYEDDGRAHFLSYPVFQYHDNMTYRPAANMTGFPHQRGAKVHGPERGYGNGVGPHQHQYNNIFPPHEETPNNLAKATQLENREKGNSERGLVGANREEDTIELREFPFRLLSCCLDLSHLSS